LNLNPDLIRGRCEEIEESLGRLEKISESPPFCGCRCSPCLEKEGSESGIQSNKKHWHPAPTRTTMKDRDVPNAFRLLINGNAKR
jgi:hypothetical protein